MIYGVLQISPLLNIICDGEELLDIEKEIVRLGAQAEKTEEKLSALTDYLKNRL